MSRAVLITTILLVVGLAGCSDGTSFDGEATLALVEDIVYEGDDLRPLVPGHPRHDEAAAWLQGQMTIPGWQVRQDSFTGAQYQELDKGGASSWADSCSQEDKDDLPGLEFYNLYGTLLGSGDGQVVLAAHWDGKEDASDGGAVPAANDGASGVALLLQLQRHIRHHELDFPFDLTIALFDGEDGFEDCHPLAGSLWAARTGALGDIDQLILLDMIGDADARFIRESQSLASDRALVDAIWDMADDHGLGSNFVSTSRAITDDHVPFIEEGVQAIDIIDAGRPTIFPPYWHTSGDTPDKLSANMLGRMGDLIVDVLTDADTQVLLQD